VAQALLRALRDAAPDQTDIWGIAAPSANRFGRVSPTTAAHVESELGPDLLILDGGPCDLGIESTIIDCTRGVPVLLRPGSISRLQMEQACGQTVLSNAEYESSTVQE
jgi:L-threonylcarbamoyladenylate synthase